MSRAAVALVAEGFLSRLSFGLVSLALPLYALHVGMSVGEVGLLLSVNVAVQLVAKPMTAPLADRFGPRSTLLAAITIRSAVCVLFAFAGTPAQLFAIRTLYGLAQALRDPPLIALLAASGGSGQVASRFAWYSTAKNVAASLGRAASGLLITVGLGYRGVFLMAFALSLLPLAVVTGWVGRVARVRPQDLADDAGQSRWWLLPFTSLGFLFGTTAGMLNLFPAIATRYFGLSPAEIGLIMLGSTVVVLLAGPTFGWLADHVNRSAVLLIRGAANITSSLLYLAFPTFGGVCVSKVVDDAGKAAFRPAWGSIMSDVARRSPGRRATVMTWIDVGEDAGDAAGPALAGALLAAGGLPLMLGTRCVLAAATEVAAWRVTHRGLVARPPRARHRRLPGQVPSDLVGIATGQG